MPLLSWPHRWMLYLSTMFQAGSRMVFASLSVLGGFFCVQKWHHLPMTVDGRWLLGTVSIWLILLYYRISDEFKDRETDQKFFPERPIPSGKVLLQDLHHMRWLATGISWALNLMWPVAPVAFALLWLFDWLMGKWFFLPRLIGENRVLAFLTHSPISLLGSAYVVALVTGPAQIRFWQWPHLLIMLWFALPGMAWEIARKTRIPEDEQVGYQTYSQQLGLPMATALPPIIFVCHGLVAWNMLQALQWGGLPLAFFLGMLFFTLIPFALFARCPTRKRALALKTSAEMYTLACLLLVPLTVGWEWFN